MANTRESIETARQAVEVTPPDLTERARQLNARVLSLRDMYLQTGAIEFLDAALFSVRLLSVGIAPDHPDQAMYLNNTATLLRDRYLRNGQITDLEEAVTISQQAVAATPPDDPDRAVRSFNVAESLRDRYNHIGAKEDLEEAVKIARHVVETAPPGHSARPLYMHSLACSLRDRYLRDKQIPDLEEAIKIARQVVETTPPDHPRRASFISNLARALRDKYLTNMTLEHLEEAIQMARQAVDSSEHQSRADCLHDLGISLRSRYSRTGMLQNLEEAIQVTRQAIEDSSPDLADRTKWSNELVSYLRDRYVRIGEQKDLEEAINTARGVVEITPPDHPNRAQRLDRLGITLRERYLQTRMDDDIEQAIQIAQQAIEATSDSQDQGVYLNNLGLYLYDRYSWTGTMEDLEEAIKVMRKAIQDPLFENLDHTRSLNNLATFLEYRYLKTGVMANLEDAIEIARQTVETAPLDYPDRAIYLNNLGNQLRNRYLRTGAMADLEQAINITRETVKATPADHPLLASRLNNLTDSLRVRHIRRAGLKYLTEKYRARHMWTETSQDLEEAIDVAQQVLKLTPPDHPNKAERLNNLAAVQGLSAAVSDETVEMQRQAVEATPLDNPSRAGKLLNLSIYLYSRSKKENLATGDLEEAVEIVLQAIRISPPDHPNLASQHLHLGDCLKSRFLQTMELTDLLASQRSYFLALEHTPAAIENRINAGRELLSIPTVVKLFHTPQHAYSISRKTIELIPFLSSRSLENNDKRHILSAAVGLSSDAAAISISAEEDAVTAVQCLEIGRGIIADSIFEQSDISALRMKHPQLASILMELLEKLDSPSSRGFSDMLDNNSHAESEGSGRQEAMLRLQINLQTIRSQHGFDRFLLPASKGDLLEAARPGPIVIINISAYRCDALIIEHTGVQILGLPCLSEKDLHSKLTSIRSLETLGWLWDVIICPIIDALGFKETPKDDKWPHVWWIPTGILTRFPLHASGHHGKACGETALDRVISSYSSSVKAIIHGRQRVRMSTPKAPRNAVVVAMPRTPKKEPLPFVSTETDTVLAIFKTMDLCRLTPQPCKPSVLLALADCQIFHFAGHGSTNPDEPLHSHLLLEDWESQPLTVESLLEVNLSSNPPFLAYLSACGTGQLLDERFMDESIHIASAYQLAGFRHVIGTLWSVDDEFSVDMARITYEFFRDAGMSDDSVSRGLHHACRTLRDQWIRSDVSDMTEGLGDLNLDRDAELDESWLQLKQPHWVPYVHYGG